MSQAAGDIEVVVAATSDDPVDWNAVWVAMQELGATLAPVIAPVDAPDWAVQLRDAMDVALPEVEAQCAEYDDPERP